MGNAKQNSTLGISNYSSPCILGQACRRARTTTISYPHFTLPRLLVPPLCNPRYYVEEGQMHWRRKARVDPVPGYSRLGTSGGICAEVSVPKGYVPLLVGNGSSAQRFVVPVRLLRDPCMATLLDMAAHELGYEQEGMLRILCDADHFQRVVHVISKSR